MFTGKLILFDLDDTLFDFSQTWHKALRQTFAAFGPSSGFAPQDVLAEFLALNDRLYPEYEQGRVSLEAFRRDRLIRTLAGFGRQTSEAEADDFHALHQTCYWQALTPDTALNGWLAQLQTQYKLGIVTNGPHDMQRGKIERLGLSALFPEAAVIVSHEAGCAKPDPRIYRLALDRFGAAPEETLFIGDSWTTDVAGPIDAGLQAIWLNKYGKPVPVGHRPMAVVSAWPELGGWLR